MNSNQGFPNFNLGGANFPYQNFMQQWNAAPGNLPPGQQFSGGSQYGRWNGVNNNAFGLAPYSWGSVFGTPGPSSMPWQPPWGGNGGGYGGNQGPGSNPNPMPTPPTPVGGASAASTYPNAIGTPGMGIANATPAPTLPPQQNPASEYYGLGGLQGQNYNDMLAYRALGGQGAFNPIYQRLNSALGGAMPNYTNMYGAAGAGYQPGMGQLQYGANGQITGIGGMTPDAFAQYLPYIQQAGLNVATPAATPDRTNPPVGRSNPR